MDCKLQEALEDICTSINKGEITDTKALNRAKRDVARRYSLSKIPSNTEIMGVLGRTIDLLQRKPVRTLSGVAIIAVMSRPAPCPHGKCSFCPGGPDYDVPQSYTGFEPAAMRAIQSNFHPFLQVYKRIEQLHSIGHPTDKIELIVMGGTFPSQDLDYQEFFVKECLSAMNLYDDSVLASEIETCLFSSDEHDSNASKILASRPILLEDAQDKNEGAKNRCVGMTFETRPDWSKRPHIDRMLNYGGTRVELGVQTVYDYIYARVKRGHTTADSKEATALLKDQGFKINYHLMPGLPGSGKERDLRMMERIFTDPDYSPDMVKFYTCLVMDGTDLHKEYLKGNYAPYTTEETIDLLVKAKSIMPPWVRTMRIQRDIPTTKIAAGVMSSNMGQLVENELQKRGISCNCIRCREVGLKAYKQGIEPCIDDVSLVRRDYNASGGKEIFLSYEDVRRDVLIGFLRLRMPGENVFRKEITPLTSLVRELHVYGPLAPIKSPCSEGPWWQHQGYGAKLLSEAERISLNEFDKKKMIIISGIGVREYYKKFGYSHDGPYVSKVLN